MIPDQADISILSKLYHSGAWVPLGILVAFFLLRALSTRVAWLKEDHRAVWVSAILGGAATLIVPLSQGTTPNISMIGAALMTVMALHADPKKTPTEQKQAQGGFARLGLLIVLSMIGAMLLFGCSASTRLKTLDSTMAALDSAEIGLMAFDQKHQNDIVNDCDPKATKAECQAKLDAYRAKRKVVIDSLGAAYDLLKHAFEVDDDPSAATAIAAATAVAAQLKGLGL